MQRNDEVLNLIRGKHNPTLSLSCQNAALAYRCLRAQAPREADAQGLRSLPIQDVRHVRLACTPLPEILVEPIGPVAARHVDARVDERGDRAPETRTEVPDFDDE